MIRRAGREGEEKRVYGFAEETIRQRLPVRPRRRWEENIKVDHKELDGMACTEFAWLKMGTELVPEVGS
jgi:hypothetical protein